MVNYRFGQKKTFVDDIADEEFVSEIPIDDNRQGSGFTRSNWHLKSLVVGALVGIALMYVVNGKK
jgi:hypothetical protein